MRTRAKLPENVERHADPDAGYRNGPRRRSKRSRRESSTKGPPRRTNRPHPAAAARGCRTFRRRIPRGKRRDKGGATGGTAASRPTWHKAARARQLDELSETAGFGTRHLIAEGGDAVITAPLVIVFRRGPVARFHDQALLEHALDGAV